MGFTDIVKGLGKSTWDQIPIVSAVTSMGKVKDGISALKDGDMGSFAREQINDFTGEDIYPTDEEQFEQSEQFESGTKGAYLDEGSDQKGMGDLAESDVFSKLKTAGLGGLFGAEEQTETPAKGMSQASMDNSLDSFGGWAEKAVLDKESSAGAHQKDDNEGMVEF